MFDRDRESTSHFLLWNNIEIKVVNSPIWGIARSAEAAIHCVRPAEWLERAAKAAAANVGNVVPLIFTAGSIIEHSLAIKHTQIVLGRFITKRVFAFNLSSELSALFKVVRRGFPPSCWRSVEVQRFANHRWARQVSWLWLKHFSVARRRYPIREGLRELTGVVGDAWVRLIPESVFRP